MKFKKEIKIYLKKLNQLNFLLLLKSDVPVYKYYCNSFIVESTYKENPTVFSVACLHQI